MMLTQKTGRSSRHAALPLPPGDENVNLNQDCPKSCRGIIIRQVTKTCCRLDPRCAFENPPRAELMPFIADAEHLENIIAQTAVLWHSVRWDGLRQLLGKRGHDPRKCLLISCDQGFDVAITLVLPDGTIIAADFREDPETRQPTRFEKWRTLDYSDREIELCRGILASNMSEFETHVRRYFDDHVAATDAPLPPKVFGVLKNKVFKDGSDVQQ